MIILDEYCWRTANAPHTGGWSCPECVGDHIALFFEWLSRLCPFCPLLVEPEHYNFIGNEFFGTPSTIGGIRCCGDCYEVATATDTSEALVCELRERQVTQ